MSGTQNRPGAADFGRGGAQGEMFEVRAVEGEIRAAGGGIEGYAAVFNQAAEILPGFREVIRPGAFGRSIEEGADVRALWNHNPDYVLGRRGSGTLAINEDEHGLRYVVRPPEAQWARDLGESIGRGDVSQSSFAFIVRLERWTQDVELGVTLRELLDVDLIDVSPVTYPAYVGTSVGLRSEAGLRAGADFRGALVRYLTGQMRGIGPELAQEIVDEAIRAQGGGGQVVGAADGAAERARAQGRLAVRRRRLRLATSYE